MTVEIDGAAVNSASFRSETMSTFATLPARRSKCRSSTSSRSS